MFGDSLFLLVFLESKWQHEKHMMMFQVSSYSRPRLPNTLLRRCHLDPPKHAEKNTFSKVSGCVGLVICCFGLAIWIPKGSPKMKGMTLLKGTPIRIPNHRAPNHQPKPSVEEIPTTRKKDSSRIISGVESKLSSRCIFRMSKVQTDEIEFFQPTLIN